MTTSADVSAAVDIPSVPGLDIRVEETVPIPGAESTTAHRFDDGRIVVAGKGKGIWSVDSGRSWSEGPLGPAGKTTINLGRGEVLSIYRTSVKRGDGKYSLSQQRSRDNWKTVTHEDALLDTPLATTMGGDSGEPHEGLLMHHGAIRLANGDLMATMYGNYVGDRVPADGYPLELKLHKYRTVVVFSSDGGRTWGRPATVAYDRQLARGTDPDSSVQTTAVVPAVTQEGFCEASLRRAADGTILCAMRSGGRLSVKAAPVFATPLYVSRSKDEGKTWTPPVAIADRGVCPYLVTLKNGVIVCAYARPGNWLIFSGDHGETWNGAFQFASTDSYCNVLEVAPHRVLVIYYRGRTSGDRSRLRDADYAGMFVKIDRK